METTPSVPQIRDSTNPTNIEIHNIVSKKAVTLAHAEIRKQYDRAMNHYEKMLNNVKVSNDIKTVEPSVQYNVESNVNTKLDNVNLADRDNILTSYFSRYGPMSLFAASLNRKRERRNLGHTSETWQSPTKQQTTELSNTLESIDYLLDHRARLSQTRDGNVYLVDIDSHLHCSITFSCDIIKANQYLSCLNHFADSCLFCIQ